MATLKMAASLFEMLKAVLIVFCFSEVMFNVRAYLIRAGN